MPVNLHRWANPLRFQRISTPLIIPCALLAVGFLVFGTIEALWLSPSDYRQGETVRIMYIHVPSAWMSLLCYASLAACSAVFLVWRHPVADIVAQSLWLPGIALTVLTIITGALWGRPTWGTYWVFDARLTSFTILLFFYIGYAVLRHSFDNQERARKTAAILALIGVIDLPIVKWSVDWWNTLHQPASISRLGSSAIDPSMLKALLLMAAGFVFYVCLVTLLGAHRHLADRKTKAILERQEADG